MHQALAEKRRIMNNFLKGHTKKQLICFFSGLTAFAVGFGILSFFGIRKICREIKKQKLMRENVVVEIPDLKIKAPVLEGTDLSILAKGAGHFTDTGAVGKGNYCIAAHSSVIYKEYFNNLKNVQNGMDIILYDIAKNASHYTVSESFYVKPSETWVLDDKGDDRVTLITCNDDGSERLVVVGLLNENNK